MSTDRDAARTVRSWLEDGATALPDRVLDAVLDELPTTPQRRATWWPARRFPQMNSTLRFGLAAAAVVAVALLGIRFLLPDQNVGPPPAPTQTPVALPDTTDVEAGTTYFMAAPWGSGTPRLIFTVPADGWSTVSATNLGKDAIDDPLDFHDIAMTPWNVTNLVADPCRRSAEGQLDPPVGPTVDDLARALRDQAGESATAPTDVTVGGYSGKRVELSLPAGLDPATCEGGGFVRWTERGTPGGHVYGSGQRNVVYILDVDGLRAVIDTSYLPGTSEASLAELEQIVASIRIEP
jgi:hypothetical protein